MNEGELANLITTGGSTAILALWLWRISARIDRVDRDVHWLKLLFGRGNGNGGSAPGPNGVPMPQNDVHTSPLDV